MPIKFHGAPRPSSLALFALAGAMLAGCQSAPSPDQMSKTATATAPADLQLLCANSVALSTGATSTNVLPVSSSQMNATDYQVVLATGAVRHICVVNTDGVVKSVSPG